MEPKRISQENQEAEEQTQMVAVSPLHLPMASISLSLSTILPANFITTHKISTLFGSHPSRVKIPAQISSLSHLSLSASPTPKSLLKSTISANPLQSPISLNPNRPSDPSNAAGLRRASIVWFRSDLRVHDNECLNAANNESMSVLPVYCFDPSDYGKSSNGFDKTGPYRASFLIESVSDLKKNLQARGSDLVVRMGKPETVLVELAKQIGAEAVYAHRDISHDDVKSEYKLEKAMKDEGIEMKFFWGSTLYHIDDLPFKLEDMPTNYSSFKEKVQSLKIRNTIEALDQMRGLPARGNVEPGEIPSLADLSLNPSSTVGQSGKISSNASLVGGEAEALQRIRTFASECQAQPNRGNKDGSDSIYGANFSCKISPWLAMGCISPRAMFDELKKSISSTISASSKDPSGDTGMNWLIYELLWRDFFRFITKKYSDVKQNTAAPVTAGTGVAV